MISDKTVNFSGSDSQELFEQNLKSKPLNWYYRNRPITYSYNSFGHRTKSPDDIDFDNYILFIGDSHTEGVGLELETTYPYCTAKQLSMDYYNLGLGGTGIDYMLHNTINWLATYPSPKYISFFWSDVARYLVYNEKDNTFLSIHANSDKRLEEEKMLVYGEMSGHFYTSSKLALQTLDYICDTKNIPRSHISMYNNCYHNNSLITIIKFKFTDHARDGHFGIETHDIVTNFLCNDYKNKYSNATVNSTTRGQI